MLVSQSKSTLACRGASARKAAVLRRLPNTSRCVLVTRSTVTDAVEPSANATGTGSAASISIDEAPAEVRVPWYKKPCLWKELSTVEELEAAISAANSNGKMSVIDFYAGWCACCKSSFPALCRIPTNDFMAQHFNFYKANIEEGNLASYIKKKGVRGIPHVLVFHPDGSDCIGMSGAFKKMEALRKNLDFIARAEKKSFVLDPNGFVINR
ncbi:hypothetical protein HXX76_008313 [Chlamydomonas incerta]|uniref:Thioredoxin domain-containing protein n=1 Tax=Chlamydomonas incerta TaxID=51695 RepID=A0A835W158_CHLIN|nr:hypothetical protein HXX76_008313 [Chlamydomonas incerta]|eukprot:KAG2433244.1 hypothetical protein HXX76_008313 [Chlamydomonas incerta]